MISVLIPTRHRTRLLAESIKSAYDTASSPANLNFKLYIDDDDQESIDWFYNESKVYHDIEAIIGPRIIFSQTYNELFFKTNCHDIIFFTGDDFKAETKNWDLEVKRVFDEYPDKVLFAYAYNNLIKHNFGSEGFLHRNSIETIGEIFPPIYMGEYCDSHVNEIYDICGRKRKLDVVITHVHYSNQLRLDDSTDHEKFARQREHNSAQKFYDSASKRREDAMKLLQYIKDHKDKVPLMPYCFSDTVQLNENYDNLRKMNDNSTY